MAVEFRNFKAATLALCRWTSFDVRRDFFSDEELLSLTLSSTGLLLKARQRRALLAGISVSSSVGAASVLVRKLPVKLDAADVLGSISTVDRGGVGLLPLASTRASFFVSRRTF